MPKISSRLTRSYNRIRAIGAGVYLTVRTLKPCYLFLKRVNLKLPCSVLRYVAVHKQKCLRDQPLPDPRPPSTPRHAGKCWDGAVGVRPAASEHCWALHSVSTCCGYPDALPGPSRPSPGVIASTSSPCPPATCPGSPVPCGRHSERPQAGTGASLLLES